MFDTLANSNESHAAAEMECSLQHFSVQCEFGF